MCRYTTAQDDLMSARDLKTAALTEGIQGIRQIKYVETTRLETIRCIEAECLIDLMRWSRNGARDLMRYVIALGLGKTEFFLISCCVTLGGNRLVNHDTKLMCLKICISGHSSSC